MEQIVAGLYPYVSSMWADWEWIWVNAVCVPGAICGDLQDSGPVRVAKETRELHLSEEEPARPLPQLTLPQSCWQEAGCSDQLGAKVGGHYTGSGCGRLKQLPATKASGEKTSPEYYSSIRQACSIFGEITHAPYSLWIGLINILRWGGVGSKDRCFLLAWSELLGMPHLHVEGVVPT